MTGSRLHSPSLLVAIAIAMAIKLAVHETEQLRERQFEANVQYNLPDDVTLVKLVETVKVRLRGPSSEVSELSPFSVQVLVDVDENALGAVVKQLERSNVTTPGDYEIISIDPNRLSIIVEPTVTAQLLIVPKVVGEPSAGSLINQQIVIPSYATVRGPAPLVQSLSHLNTAPISLDGHALTFSEEASLVSPDPLLQILEPDRVVVTVDLLEPELSSTVDALAEDSLDVGASGGNP